jgi:hypothetical protein
VQTSFDAGNTTRVDVLLADSQLANDETLLPPAVQDLAVARHALAVLLGRAPADWTPPELDFGALTLPPTLPVSVPSELAHQRPDILAAEAELHAATAQVGVATANLYPHLTLTGSVGQQALTLGTLFTSGNGVWALASGLSAPVFDGGTLRAARRADIDAMQASAANYQETVLQGLRQVADVLTGIEQGAQLLAAETRALDAAQASLNLTRESYRAGNVGVLQVLDAERAYSRARLEYVRVQAQRYADTASSFLPWAAPSRKERAAPVRKLARDCLRVAVSCFAAPSAHRGIGMALNARVASGRGYRSGFTQRLIEISHAAIFRPRARVLDLQDQVQEDTAAVLACVMLAAGATSGAFEQKPWIDDLEQVKEALATKYANLEWAVFEREIDLQGLFAETQGR